MTKHTFTTLVQLNSTFYETIANDFSDSRNASWSGWDQLIPVLKKYSSKAKKLKILDIGCGNGRFYTFLQSQLDIDHFLYYGIDNSEALLDSAKTNYQDKPNTSFIKSDVISKNIHTTLSQDIIGDGFDLIVCFGVFHHIPSQEARRAFLNQLETLLAPHGTCCISCWQFTNSPNLMKRQLPPEKINLLPSDLEPNDYILDWQRGPQAYRYCHLTTQAEMTSLADQTRLKVIDFWIADGKTNNINHYYLFEEKAQ